MIFGGDFRTDVGGDGENELEILNVRIKNYEYADFHVVPWMGSLN